MLAPTRLLGLAGDCPSGERPALRSRSHQTHGAPDPEGAGLRSSRDNRVRSGRDRLGVCKVTITYPADPTHDRHRAKRASCGLLPTGRCEGGTEEVRWREIELLTLHRLSLGERPAGPHRATGQAGADPTTRREKGALLQTLRVCVRPPGGGAPLAPAGSVPIRRMAPDREGHPALPNPPRPPSRVDRAAVRLALVLATAARGPTAKERLADAICVASGNARSSTVCGGPVGRSAAERRAGRGLREGEKDARRWAVPCHGHGRGRRPAWGAPAASSLVLSRQERPAGRLDPTSHAGSSTPAMRQSQEA